MQSLTPNYNPQPSLDKDDINALPLITQEIPVELLTSANQARQALRHIANEPLLGFDTETRPAFRKGQSYLPSLIQLATRDCAYIFQISRYPIPAELLEILASPHHCKSGAGLSYDIRQLQQMRRFKPDNFTELGDIATQLGLRQTGLRSLCALIFGQRLSKGAQCSDWSRHHLTQVQIQYAATDAWVSRELYVAMEAMLRRINQHSS
ncbi:3'-5' exonuclease [Desulfurispira natronophila]|uniref:Ribonuclease D n=1 Tax=Desulfurispira natronophila TaxID=682562 RepID=A0A7W7Y469_9BACT|nr:3'-5' exonuclease [Desulfurispira natronophila]MBB5021778.1 ribonuclease D [Desulfurispira natronophila]